MPRLEVDDVLSGKLELLVADDVLVAADVLLLIGDDPGAIGPEQPELDQLAGRGADLLDIGVAANVQAHHDPAPERRGVGERVGMVQQRQRWIGSLYLLVTTV